MGPQTNLIFPRNLDQIFLQEMKLFLADYLMILFGYSLLNYNLQYQ